MPLKKTVAAAATDRDIMFGGLTFYKLIARAIVLLTSIPAHEAAHAYAAYKMGDDTARHGKRMSLNPFDHIDPVGALMIMVVGIGWAKPVPVNSYNFRNRKLGMVVTSIAGPLSNIGLAIISMILYKVLLAVGFMTPAVRDLLSGPVQVLWIMVSSNITLAIFNLLPVPPLDGWRIASVFLPPKIHWQIMEHERQIGLGLMFLVFLGFLDVPLRLFSNMLLVVVEKLTFFVDIAIALII